MGLFRKSLSTIFCCLASAALLFGALWLQTRQDLPGYQYIISANGNAAGLYHDAVDILSRKNISDAVISGRYQHALIQTVYGSESITVYAIDDHWHELHFDSLCEGRFITQRDVSRASCCIVISESLARKCIPAGNAIGKRITLEGHDFIVIGIIRDGLHPGETDDFVVYVPITTDMIGDTTLMISIPKATAEKMPTSVWSEMFQRWSPNGSFHHIAQEVFKAWMFCYVLLLWLMLIIIGYAGGCWKHVVKQSIHNIQTRLEITEWKECLYISRKILMLVVTGIFVALGWWLFLKLLVYPLQLFPEYVPSEPVRLSSWITSVRLMIHDFCTGAVYYSTENKLVMISGGMITASGFLLMAMLMTVMKKRDNSLPEWLTSLFTITMK